MPSDRATKDAAAGSALTRRWKRARGVQLNYVEEAIPDRTLLGLGDTATATLPTPGLAPAPPPPPARRPHGDRLTPTSGSPASAARRAAPRAVPEDSFRPVPSRPAFNPGNRSAAAYAAQGSRATVAQPATTRRRRRSTRTTLIRLGVLVVLAGTVKVAAAPVHASAEKWSRASVESDLREAATAEDAFHRLYDRYAADRSQLTVESTFNDVLIVSADASRYCLEGHGLIGAPVWLSSDGGVSDTPCR